MGRSLIECFCMVYKTPSSCFSVILYCVKMRKVESINFRFGGRSTSFCSSDWKPSKPNFHGPIRRQISGEDRGNVQDRREGGAEGVKSPGPRPRRGPYPLCAIEFFYCYNCYSSFRSQSIFSAFESARSL